MKFELFARLGLGWVGVMSVSLLVACGSHSGSDPAVQALTQEKARLQAENQALDQARSENEEVRRLKSENQELAKARSQYQEAARLKKDNAQLRQQIAKIKPPAGQGGTAGAISPAASALAAPGQVGDQVVAQNETGLAEDIINDGDDILVEPKYLKQLLPDFDWDKLDRKEPLSIRALLEKDGIQLTNTAQLREYGLTNFVIQRPAASIQPQPQQPQPQE